MKVLITCGPTWVALDDVRVISNISTGTMGRLIAAEFKKAGARVTLLQGPMFFDEFAKALKAECAKKYDVVVHAAAVSDFRPQKTLKGKASSGRPLNIKLVPTLKLINAIKRIAPETFLVGFKLQSSLNKAVVESKKLFIESGCDLVLANSVRNGYRAQIMDADGNVLAKAHSKQKAAQDLVKLLI